LKEIIAYKLGMHELMHAQSTASYESLFWIISEADGIKAQPGADTHGATRPGHGLRG
jgi:hypothetical protein